MYTLLLSPFYAVYTINRNSFFSFFSIFFLILYFNILILIFFLKDWSPNLIAIGRIVNALLSAIGPELDPFGETMRRLYSFYSFILLFTPLLSCEGLRSELECSPNVMARVEAVKFIQMLAVFAPQTVNVTKEMTMVCFRF
jgi:hypothetical protein